MRPTILTDDDLAAGVDMSGIIATIESALQAKAAGTLVAPPRLQVPFDRAGKLVFAVGGTTSGTRVAGFRAYQTFTDIRPDQNVVAVWDQATDTAPVRQAHIVMPAARRCPFKSQCELGMEADW